MNNTILLGDVEVTRLVEWHGHVAPMPVVFPSVDEVADTRRSADELAPDFRDPQTDDLLANAQTWVLRSEGRVILVDTGIGNHKERSYMPAWNRRDHDFIGQLEQAGITSDEVDLVINTHIHADHVGWNTELVDRTWVPAFRNADYLVAKADYDYWNPRNDIPKQSVFGGVNARLANGTMFEDSIDPVFGAGQMTLWEGGFRIDGNLVLEPAPGHTPGSAVLRLDSGTDHALFIGDVVHSPLQFTEPGCETCLSEYPDEAIATRRRILADAADRGALVFPAHLPGGGAAEIERSATGFAVRRWADL